MKISSVILVLLSFYTIMLLSIALINRMRPGFASPRSLAENLNLLNVLHGGGIILMLLPAWIVTPLPGFLLSFPDNRSSEQLLGLLICSFAIFYFPWKKFAAGEQDHKPNFCPPSQTVLYIFLRIFFLTTYEWFFRGLLLFSLYKWLGLWWAIASNISLYTLMHIHKHKKEIIGCIPFGLLLCVFTIWWQSVWPAIILHLQVAILNEWPELSRLTSAQKQPSI